MHDDDEHEPIPDRAGLTVAAVLLPTLVILGILLIVLPSCGVSAWVEGVYRAVLQRLL